VIRTTLVVTLAVATCACSGNSAIASDGGESPDGRATTVFADEFNGTVVDRAKWTVYTGPVYNSELQVYVDDTSNVFIARGAEAAGASDGVLVLRARHHPGGVAGAASRVFTSARLHGRIEFQFGTAAARMKLPAGSGLWPAFWLLGAGEWPANGEIDVMENVGDSTWVSMALHGPGYSGNTPLTRRITLPASLDVTAWHEYAVTWTADSIVFRVDGNVSYRVARADVAKYGPASALDRPKYVVLNLAIGGEYPAAVNGARTPYLGLPESTLPRIQRGEAKVLVDWVRVTR
jgi:beta-glucanase (GH16 family)